MRRALIAAGLLVAAACGGSGDDADVSSGSDATITVATTIGSEAAQDEPDETDDESAPETTESDPSTPVPAEVDGDTGLLPLTLPAVTVTEGDPGVEGAGRPTFAWDAVDGAAEYFVVVHLDGQPDWGVTTTDTSATVGGATLQPNATGPRVTNDMVWYVVASDADGTPIAQSAARPVVTTID